MAKQNKPAIRFKEFTDAWEQRKLGELLKTITTGKSVNSDDGAVAVGDIGILKTSCVSYDRFNPYESKPVVKDELQSVKCAVEKDSVIVSRMNTPERVGACGYVSTDFPNLFLPDRLWKLKFQDNVDAYFVYMMLVSSVYKEKITSMASGTSGSMYNIPKETFLNLQLVVPVQTSEQRKIGQVLRQLNDLITLHQRKYDKLQVLKKAMLEKMFPKNGSSVPEIRFKGFTDAWEQRKLEDYLTVSTEKNTGNIYGRSDVLSVSGDYGIVNQIEFQGRSFAGASVSNYGVVQTGDVVYTKSPLNSNPYGIIKTNKGKPGIVSTLYAVYHPKKNAFSDFIQVYFEQHARMNNYMHPLVNKGAKNDMKVSAENALKGPVCFPSRIEQESISAFFSVLDNLITLHQRKPYSHIQRRCNMLNEAQSTDKFCEYYAKWITVYKKGAIRQVTMDKYLMTQK